MTFINAANGANTITANGADDTITLGVVSTGTAITAAQTIHAAGAGDVITFATQAADGTAVTWAGASTVDGGNTSTGIGANSTVNFGNNTGGGSETVVVAGDLTGATTTTGISMITLGNVVNDGGDQIVFNNAATELLTGTGAVRTHETRLNETKPNSATVSSYDQPSVSSRNATYAFRALIWTYMNSV